MEVRRGCFPVVTSGWRPWIKNVSTLTPRIPGWTRPACSGLPPHWWRWWGCRRAHARSHGSPRTDRCSIRSYTWTRAAPTWTSQISNTATRPTRRCSKCWCIAWWGRPRNRSLEREEVSLIIFLGWGVSPGPENPYLFQTKIYEFPYPISDLTLKMYTLFQTLWCVANSATLNRSTAYGTSWRPKRCSCLFFLRDQRPRKHTLL